MSTKLIIPTATESDWQWREYKAYVAMCGDYVECEIFMGKAVALFGVKWQMARHMTWTSDSAIIGKLKQPERELEAVGEGLR